MDVRRWQRERVYLYRHPVDMRKGIGGLSAIVALELELEPRDDAVFGFINRGRDKLKLLVWHRNGYWLLYKRLEKQRFSWPDWFDGEHLCLTEQELDYLLDGYNLNGMRPHHKVHFNHHF